MISIVISEKGGSERRERYEQDEITIGRVKGNDVLLPKGNVSKRHARLIVRDGRYIVTDLKSTNGTYVNHRRITHATLVREGDRIYVGDFVLRLEDPSHSGSSSAPASPSYASSPGSSTSQSALSALATGTPAVGSPALDATHAPGPPDDVVSHFPIEHDPDDSSPMLEVPGPPRIPTGLRNITGSQPAASPTGADAPSTHETRGSSPGSLARSSEPHSPSLSRSSEPISDDRSVKLRTELLERVIAQVEQDLGSDAISLETDAAATSGLQTAVDAAVARVLEDATTPLDPQLLRNAAMAELVDIGPLGPLLADENITQIQIVMRHVVLHRRGRLIEHEGFGFGSEAGVARALARLRARSETRQTDATGPYLELELADGRSVFAVQPGASLAGHLITIKQPERKRTTLDMLVRNGAISRGMATLLANCVSARANMLVAGGAESGVWEVVAALVEAVPRHARALWLRDRSSLDIVPEGFAGLDIGGGPQERLSALKAAARLGADHLVVPPLTGQDLGTVLDAVTAGAEGLVMCTVASTLRQALDRLSADLAGTRGIAIETAREWLGASFDLGLEVTRLRDGRPRVLRLAELRSSGHGTTVRDIFTFSYHRTAAGGSIEGAFYASGTIPHIVEDLAVRGTPLDTSIFRRQPGV